jgi:hypothetical protein
MLLFPDDVTPKERGDLDNHLRKCADCRKGATMIEMTRTALAGLGPVDAPRALRAGLWTRRPRPAALPHRRVLTRGRQLGLAAIALLVVGAWALFSTLDRQAATPANAYAILQRAGQLTSGTYPYSGSSRVNFTKIPWYLLPPEVANYAGHYEIVTRWWVKDANHFRVDVQVLNPALERGSITAVLNGGNLTIYDARTGRATVLRRPYIRQLRATYPFLLSFLQNGAQVNGLYSPSPVAPNRSISDYLASLRADRAQPGVHPYARVLRQTRMLGYPVDVIDFGPLSVTTYDSSGCFPSAAAAPNSTPVVFPPAGPCHHYAQSIGWARVFVERDHPLVLRFEEHGVNRVQNIVSESINYRYQVTALRFHAQPPAGVLDYRPPVTPAVSRLGGQQPVLPGVSTQQGGDELTAPGFVDVPQPSAAELAGYGRLATTFFAQEQSDHIHIHYAAPPFPVIRGMDVLFAQVRHWVKIYTSWHGQASIYVTGPYMLVQERLLVTGLPSAFMAGAALKAGSCSAWTGRYSDGQHWIAFQRSRVSIVISSNRLTVRQLVGYMSQDICR